MTNILSPALNINKGVQARDITVDGSALLATPADLLQVKVQHQAMTHEQVTITARVQRARIDAMKDKLITFSYGPRVTEARFYGYVVYINSASDYKVDTVCDLICFGTSWPMQSGTPRWTKGRTAPIVAGIVNTYGLGFQGDMDTYEWPGLAQTDESDWGFICALADRIGWMVVPHDGVVRYIDPLQALKSELPVIRLLKGDDVTDNSRQLYAFTPSSVSDNMRTLVKPSFGFFVGTDATVDNPLVFPYRFETKLVVKDRAMADAYRDAWDRHTSVWNQEAKARIQGNPQLLPGQVVDIDLSGPHTAHVQDVRNDYNGLWLVVQVTHSLTNNSFQTELALTRTGAAIVPSNTQYLQYWSGTGRPRVQQKEVEHGVKRWVSSWKSPVWSNAA